jgi:1,4-dihydroxy-2-naphthoyl-CoA synthase
VGPYQDLLFELVEEGIATITINRPEVRNAFRLQTVAELQDAFEICRENSKIGVVILTGQGPDAFCSGADLKVADVTRCPEVSLASPESAVTETVVSAIF